MLLRFWYRYFYYVIFLAYANPSRILNYRLDFAGMLQGRDSTIRGFSSICAESDARSCRKSASSVAAAAAVMMPPRSSHSDGGDGFGQSDPHDGKPVTGRRRRHQDLHPGRAGLLGRTLDDDAGVEKVGGHVNAARG